MADHHFHFHAFSLLCQPWWKCRDFCILINKLWGILQAYAMHCTWLLYQIYFIITTFFSDITTNTQNVWKNAIISQIWPRVEFYFTCISNPWYLITLPHMKEIHSAIMVECVRTDWQMEWGIDWTLSYSPQFRLSREGNNNVQLNFGTEWNLKIL